MQRTRILNEKEVKEYNEKYGRNFHSIMIQQIGDNFFAIVDCDIKIKLYKKEALNYFNK